MMLVMLKAQVLHSCFQVCYPFCAPVQQTHWAFSSRGDLVSFQWQTCYRRWPLNPANNVLRMHRENQASLSTGDVHVWRGTSPAHMTTSGPGLQCGLSHRMLSALRLPWQRLPSAAMLPSRQCAAAAAPTLLAADWPSAVSALPDACHILPSLTSSCACKARDTSVTDELCTALQCKVRQQAGSLKRQRDEANLCKKHRCNRMTCIKRVEHSAMCMPSCEGHGKGPYRLQRNERPLRRVPAQSLLQSYTTLEMLLAGILIL